MIDTAQKAVPGEERTFPDGSTRKLESVNHGVYRWVSEGKGGSEQGRGTGGGNSESAAGATVPPVIEEEKPLQMINREEWMKYNDYLTMDNPYIYITNYEEGLSIWLTKVNELDGLRRILQTEEQLYQASREEELNNLEEFYVKNNNYFLSLQMYKMCALIQEISKYDHSFDYEAMIQQGASWKDFTDYLEKAKQDE